MKILELTNYTAGGCGVFSRVKQESGLLSNKGHEVLIFSSYFEKGTNKIMPYEEKNGNVLIKRFPSIKLGGESFMFWFGKKAYNEALKFNPEIVIVHSYRHLHTIRALRLKSKLKCKVFLVTHAPFGRDRGLFQNIFVFLYDYFIGKRTLNKFDKIITITRWESAFLEKLSVKKEKLVYIPNGINDKFFKNTFKNTKAIGRDILIYTGRVSPIKNLEAIIWAVIFLKGKIKAEILGPCEEKYLRKLNKLIEENNVEKLVSINNKVYNQKEQIDFLDKGNFFILPSLSEGMPQVLIEAMARGKICLVSINPGTKEIVNNGVNGFLFDLNNKNSIVEVINKVLLLNKRERNKISKNAINSVKGLKWSILIDKLENLF
ncbi:MAG: glycosyltransferase family 4 protein [Candidatus Pacearchaeota archaeon]